MALGSTDSTPAMGLGQTWLMCGPPQLRMVPLPMLIMNGYGCATFAYEKHGVPNWLDWLEVFRASIPTFKAHAQTDVSMIHFEARQVRWAFKHFACMEG